MKQIRKMEPVERFLHCRGWVGQTVRVHVATRTGEKHIHRGYVLSVASVYYNPQTDAVLVLVTEEFGDIAIALAQIVRIEG